MELPMSAFRCTTPITSPSLAKAESVRRTDTAFLSKLHDLFLSLEFIEGLCLFMKHGGNGLNGITLLEALGEWVFGQCYARLSFIVLQGSLI
jgi:hypothetical protein